MRNVRCSRLNLVVIFLRMAAHIEVYFEEGRDLSPSGAVLVCFVLVTVFRLKPNMGVA